jgi:fatty acid desaturase 6
MATSTINGVENGGNGLQSRKNTERSVLSVKEVDKETGDVTDYVDLEKLPEFQILNQKVTAVIQSSSFWERYGLDLTQMVAAYTLYYISYLMLASKDNLIFASGIIVMGLCHTQLTVKVGHAAVHGAMSSSPTLNKLICFMTSDFIGTFSTDVGYDIHIKTHHPHTNIIGLGDSSTWKAPFVPNFLYMFVTPLLTPILICLVSMKEILKISTSWFKVLRHVLIAYGGLAFHLYLLLSVSKLSLGTSLLVMFLNRNVLTIPYIHVNIFQHIGLPMYSQKHRPKKIYQMTTGVLNLPRNPILDFTFGHSIQSCHIEHHLFPKLSDNMCLKVQPVVKAFCLENGLPYHYDTYVNRTKIFLFDYQHLMVNAPPITKFVGLQ